MNNRGPRSPAGKAAVSTNSLTHGLTAAAIVLPSESEDEWNDFCRGVQDRLAAEGVVESALASRISELLWRLRRVAGAEAQALAVAQTHRDAIAIDRSVTEQEVDFDSEPNGDELRRAARDDVTKVFGIYARAHIAESVASRYRETLPVLLPDDNELDRLIRYEAHLSRLLKHMLHELEALQERRRGNPSPLARLDIN